VLCCNVQTEAENKEEAEGVLWSRKEWTASVRATNKKRREREKKWSSQDRNKPGTATRCRWW